MERNDLLRRHSPRTLRRAISGIRSVSGSTVRAGSGRPRSRTTWHGAVRALGRPVIRIDSDGFHHVRAIRYRQGRDSARGYYEDAYDFDSLRDLVLIPLGPGGSRRFATKVHDLASDAVVREEADAPADAVVLFDATFLQRGSLRDHWDEVVYLHAPEAAAQARGIDRDAVALGGAAAALAAYESRYTAAFRIYLAEERPLERAGIVIDHTDPLHPAVLRGLGGASASA